MKNIYSFVLILIFSLGFCGNSFAENDPITIQVLSNNEDYGVVAGGGQYELDEMATISATANVGYVFVKWDDDETSPSRNFTVTQEETFTAIFGVLTKIPAKSATCEEAGNNEYWYSEDLGKYYTDNTAATETTVLEQTISVLNHDYEKDVWTWSEDYETASLKFICKNDESHVENISAEITTDTTYATCTSDGKIVYTAKVVFEGNEYKDEKTVVLPAINHDYEKDVWTWNEDYETASLKFICKNDESHVENIDAEITTDTTYATCTSDGKIVYTATVNFEGNEYKDEKTVVLPAINHDYEKDVWTWSDDYETASLKFICKNDESHVENIDAEITTDTTKATCTSDGKIVYTATVNFEGNEYKDEKTVVLPAINHDYEKDVWTWSDDYETASLKFICKNDESHVENIDAEITTDTTKATCTEDGNIVYSATVNFEGNEYKDEKTVVLPAINHDYEKDVWTWSDDYETASLKFICKNDESHVENIEAEITTDTTKATCTSDGKIVYTATVNFEGNEYKDEKTVLLPAINHDYEKDVWTWSDDYETASLKFICKNDETHVENIVAEITTDTTKATCTEDGNIVYTAKVVFEGNEYKDEKTVVLPAINHDYEKDVWTWSDDYETASLKFICKNDESHVENISAEITTDTTKATCTSDGKIVYTATVNFEGNEYKDEKTEVLPALNHDYEKDVWTWSDDYETAGLKFICKNDESHVENISAEITTDATKATCTSDGKIVYTATVNFEGNEYKDEKTVVLPAINHDYEKDVWTWSDDYETASLKFICKNDESHVENIVAEITTDTTKATCTSDGKIVYTAKVVFEGNEYKDEKTVVLPAINHDYEKDVWTWSEGYETASLKFICKNDESHVENILAEITTDTTKATCTSDGKIVYTATVNFEGNEYKDEKTVVLPALNHDYEKDVWTWSEDYETAGLKFVCKNDESHVENIVAEITTDTTKATCTSDGKIVYAAKVVFEGNEYKDEKTVLLPAINHDYEKDVWTWSEDYETAGLKFICKNDETHVENIVAEITTDTTKATCTSDGKIVYAAKVVFEGNEYKDEKTVVLPALNHDYEKDVWTWSDDYETASLKFICKNDESHVENISAEITTDTTKATCTSDGKIVYTATVNFEGNEYKDEKTVVLPAINHDYEKDVWTWSDDYETASLKFLCKNDESHIENISAEITTDTTFATCTESGLIVYTAVTSFEGVEYADTVKVIINPTDHNYVAKDWTWNEDLTQASLHFVCANDDSHIEDILVNVETDTTRADGVANLTVTYTATVSFYGETYIDKKSKTLPVKFDVAYFVTGEDRDGDLISDAYHKATGGLLKESTDAYWSGIWQPNIGDFFMVKMTGVADYTGKLQFVVVDHREEVRYWSQLTDYSKTVYVTEGEEFTAVVPLVVINNYSDNFYMLTSPELEIICKPNVTSSSAEFSTNDMFLNFTDFKVEYESKGNGENPYSLMYSGDVAKEYAYLGEFKTDLEPFDEEVDSVSLSISFAPNTPADFFSFALVEELEDGSYNYLTGEEFIKIDKSQMWATYKDYAFEAKVPVVASSTSVPKILFYTESPYKKNRVIYFMNSLNLSVSKSHSEEIVPGVPPTCTTPGLTEGKRCPICGLVFVEQKEIPALGHTEEFIPGFPPTCTNFGLTDGIKCSVCGEILKKQDTIPALGHKIVIDSPVAPTFTETGLTEGSHCSVCGEVLVAQEIVPVLIDMSIHVTNVALDNHFVLARKGKMISLQATVLPEDATNKKLIWLSDDETVASVLGGYVSLKGKGQTEIIVTSDDNSEFADTCVVVCVDASDLLAQINSAKDLLESSQEGTETGMYQIGSKEIFSSALDAAKSIFANLESLQTEIDNALMNLQAAVEVFKNSVVTEGTAISEYSSQSPIVYVRAMNIVIENAENHDVNVYDINGRRIEIRKQISQKQERIAVKEKGVYFVVVGTQVFEVIVK